MRPRNHHQGEALMGVQSGNSGNWQHSAVAFGVSPFFVGGRVTAIIIVTAARLYCSWNRKNLLSNIYICIKESEDEGSASAVMGACGVGCDRGLPAHGSWKESVQSPAIFGSIGFGVGPTLTFDQPYRTRRKFGFLLLTGGGKIKSNQSECCCK